jgi:hypothetical protein
MTGSWLGGLILRVLFRGLNEDSFVLSSFFKTKKKTMNGNQVSDWSQLKRIACPGKRLPPNVDDPDVTNRFAELYAFDTSSFSLAEGNSGTGANAQLHGVRSFLERHLSKTTSTRRASVRKCPSAATRKRRRVAKRQQSGALPESSSSDGEDPGRDFAPIVSPMLLANMAATAVGKPRELRATVVVPEEEEEEGEGEDLSDTDDPDAFWATPATPATQPQPQPPVAAETAREVRAAVPVEEPASVMAAVVDPGRFTVSVSLQTKAELLAETRARAAQAKADAAALRAQHAREKQEHRKAEREAVKRTNQATRERKKAAKQAAQRKKRYAENFVGVPNSKNSTTIPTGEGYDPGAIVVATTPRALVGFSCAPNISGPGRRTALPVPAIHRLPAEGTKDLDLRQTLQRAETEAKVAQEVATGLLTVAEANKRRKMLGACKRQATCAVRASLKKARAQQEKKKKKPSKARVKVKAAVGGMSAKQIADALLLNEAEELPDEERVRFLRETCEATHNEIRVLVHALVEANGFAADARATGDCVQAQTARAAVLSATLEKTRKAAKDQVAAWERARRKLLAWQRAEKETPASSVAAVAPEAEQVAAVVATLKSQEDRAAALRHAEKLRVRDTLTVIRREVRKQETVDRNEARKESQRNARELARRHKRLEEREAAEAKRAAKEAAKAEGEEAKEARKRARAKKKSDEEAAKLERQAAREKKRTDQEAAKAARLAQKQEAREAKRRADKKKWEALHTNRLRTRTLGGVQALRRRRKKRRSQTRLTTGGSGQRYTGIGHARMVDHDFRRLTNGSLQGKKNTDFFQAEDTAPVRAHRQQVLARLHPQASSGWRDGLDTASIHPLAWKTTAWLLHRGFEPIKADVKCSYARYGLATAADAVWRYAGSNRLLVVELKKWNKAHFHAVDGMLPAPFHAIPNSPFWLSQLQLLLTTLLMHHTFDLEQFSVQAVVLRVDHVGVECHTLDARLERFLPDLLGLCQRTFAKVGRIGRKRRRVYNEPIRALVAAEMRTAVQG